MPYADTDFFIAIANSDDRLNSWAIKVLEEYEGHIYTSILTLVELALLSVRKGIPVEGMIASVLSIADLKGASKSSALAAAHLIDHEKTGVFDSFHASLCGGEIISSDHIYEKLGVKRSGSNYL
jgi:predicted nucleic acid-binding protein